MPYFTIEKEVVERPLTVGLRFLESADGVVQRALLQ